MDKITMSGAIAPLAPTFNGHIATTMDAAILFEACLQGRIPHVPRRPHDRERQDLIASGNVFIYEEHASGIKRWTDGVSWSPSRILGNFLIYRELEKPFPPGEKKRALKKKKQSNGGINRPDRANSQSHGAAFAAVSNVMGSGQASDPERSLVGSLIDSYPFKENGLIKKTISIHFQGVPHHLVSYYSLEEALSGTMATPSNHVNFSDIRPRHELLMNQNFRNPLDEAAIFTDDRGLIPLPVANYYAMAPAVQDLSPQAIVMSQPMPMASLPSPHAAYPGGLEYEFFAAQQQQQAPHPHQALPHLPEPHHHHHDAHQAQQQQQQQQLQHHHYQYEAQQPHHHHHHHHHHLQHQLQQQQVQHHEDHQRAEYQRHFSVAEMQQPLHNQQHPSPEAEPQQPQHQAQQQPPSGGYATQGGQWPYDPNDYYFG
ncbi:Gti1/Pac2 family domain-containing protein [Trichoderma sp. SZMC 28014]